MLFIIQFDVKKLIFYLDLVTIASDDVSSVVQKENKLLCFVDGFVYPQNLIMTEIRTKAGGLFVVAGSYGEVMSRINPKTGADACASDVLG